MHLDLKTPLNGSAEIDLHWSQYGQIKTALLFGLTYVLGNPDSGIIELTKRFKVKLYITVEGEKCQKVCEGIAY